MSLISKMKKNKLIKNSMLSEASVEQGYISTSCLPLNVLFSGKLDGGIIIGQMNQSVAPSSLGKSFVGMKVARNAQKKGMEVLYLDTEFAFDYSFAKSVGINTDELLVVQDNKMESVQQTLIATIEELELEERKGLLVIIDSWGGLVTSKTVNDAISGKDVTDMTIAKKKNALARLLTGMGVTVFVINQTYECQVGESLVRTDQGDKQIKDIQVGDNVLSYNGYEEVLKTVAYDNVPTYDIELDDGTIFSVTERHRFFCRVNGEDVWLQAGEITPNTEILTVDVPDLIVPV